MKTIQTLFLILMLAAAASAQTPDYPWQRLGQTPIVTSAGTVTYDVANCWYVHSGTTCTATLPAVSGNDRVDFYIFNRGSGALTIQRAGSDNLKTTAGTATSATVAANAWAAIYNDGSYWLVRTGGGGLQTTDIDTSADLKAILTDETGSGGAAVFATSPTITTPTIAGATVTGNLIFTDNTYDIGASSATRPKSYYGSQNITIGPGDGNSLFTFNRTATGNFGRFSWFLSGTEEWALGVRGDEGGAETLSLTGHTSDSNPLVMRVRRGSATSCYQLDLSNGTATAPHMAIVGATSKALTESSATAFVQIAVASGNHTSGVIHYTIHANDASDFQCRTGDVHFSIVNKAGTETAALGTVINESIAVSSGTLTVSFDTDTSPTNAVNIRANAVSSLTQTTLAIEYRVEIFGPTTTVTPQ